MIIENRFTSVKIKWVPDTKQPIETVDWYPLIGWVTNDRKGYNEEMVPVVLFDGRAASAEHIALTRFSGGNYRIEELAKESN